MNNPRDHLDHLDYPLLSAAAPVLRRGADILQIGVDSDRVVHLEHCPAGLEHLLALLDGRHSRSTLRRSALRIGVSTDLLDDLVERLARVGLVAAGGGGPAARPLAAVRLIGAGRLGRAVAGLLFAAEVTHLEVVDDNPVDASIYPGYAGLRSQADALTTVLQHQARPVGGHPRLVVGRHWSTLAEPSRAGRPGMPEPTLTVVTTDLLEIDRMVTDTLLRADQPHLVVRGSGDGVVVGPLVWPGRTTCVRCTDLVRRERDPGWPALLPQLCRLPAPLPPAAVGWAAGVAAAEALAALGGANGLHSPVSGATVELRADYSTRWRTWPLHPECGCTWTAAVA